MKSNILYVVVIVLGLISSGYLLFHDVETESCSGSHKSFCAINSTFDCDAVAKSPYSTILGTPIAALGMAFYLALLMLFYFSKTTGIISISNFSTSLSYLFTILAVIDSISLGYISIMKICAICLVCFFTYLLNILLLIFHIIKFRFNPFRVFFQSLKEIFILEQKQLFPLVTVLLMLLFSTLTCIFSADYVRRVYNFGAEFGSNIKKLMLISESKTESMSLTKEISIKNDKNEDVIINTDKKPLIGSPQASNLLFIFSDYLCPACQLIDLKIETYIDDFKEKLAYVHKYFPLDKNCNPLLENRSQMHAFACESAYASYCANLQGRFREFHKKLFELSPEINEKVIFDIASKFNLNLNEFKECFHSNSTRKEIKNDIEEGIKLGITGTPTFILNGKFIEPIIKKEEMERYLPH